VAVTEPETKGSGFVGALAQLRKMASTDEFERMVAVLPSDTAELARRPPLPVAWLPLRQFIDLLRAAHEVLFGGDESKVSDWGRRALIGDLRTIYKMFIRFLSPQFVIERGAKLWDTYMRNAGHVRAITVGERACDVVYEGLPATLMSSAYWAYQRGCLHGVMEATGLRGIEVELVEGGGDSNHARFRVSWA